MKKWLFWVYLCGALSLHSCSDDNQSTTSSTLPMQRGTSGEFRDYDQLLLNMYNGRDSVCASVTYRHNSVNYKVANVLADSGSGYTLRGYLMYEDRNNTTAYYTGDFRNGIIDEYVYNFSRQTYDSRQYDVSHDSIFQHDGFSPTIPEVQGRRFWGWEYNMHGPCVNGTRTITKTYYVCWVGVNTVDATDENGDVLTEPCGPSVLGDD